MDSLLNLKLLNRNVCGSGIDIQIRHGTRDKLTDYWATKGQLYTPFYDTDETGPYLHVLCYLHFTDNRNEPDRPERYFDIHTMALGLTHPKIWLLTKLLFPSKEG